MGKQWHNTAKGRQWRNTGRAGDDTAQEGCRRRPGSSGAGERSGSGIGSGSATHREPATRRIGGIMARPATVARRWRGEGGGRKDFR